VVLRRAGPAASTLLGVGIRDADRDLSVWSAAPLRRLATMPGIGAGSFVTAAIDADGRTVYVQTSPGLIRRWDSLTGKVEDAARISGGTDQSALQLSPTGDRLVAVGDSLVTSWRVNGRRLSDARTYPITPVRWPAPPPFVSATQIAVPAADNDSVELLDVATGRRTPVTVPAGEGTVLAASPETHRLAVANTAGMLTVIDLATGRSTRYDDIGEHASTMTYFDHGRALAIGTGSGGLLITDGTSGGVPAPFGGADGAMVAVTELPDGSLLTSGVRGSETWQAGVSDLLRFGCRVVTRAFDGEEALRYAVTAGSTPCRQQG
jgi:WD40 repeat protein